MDKKMIEQWAREAGGWLDKAAEGASGSPIWLLESADFERFAALVAAHEREQCAQQLDATGNDHCAAAICARTELSQFIPD